MLKLPGNFVADECISAFNQLRSGPEGTRPKFIIYKISDDRKSIVVEETSTEKDWNFFRLKLWHAADKDGNPTPRYAVYNMEYEVGSEGKQTTAVFIDWNPCCAPLQMCLLYLNNRQKLTIPFDLKVSIEADCMEDLEWAIVVKEVSEELGMGNLPALLNCHA
ncbi:Actin-binding, cofilin/tropomyosin type [Penicillium italicum]|uniref:Cofilin n=1 Tax=Penicillium italicum TaxID=40296 RepID=A0A0A2KWL8_PENIT|nr:Actin-binding, cofilin/tropomyosin type [Penicillium italicum]